MLAFKDILIALLLFALALAINLIGLDALQFFRHTEADRSLIAWEMALSGDYLVPHLIHSPILTKPPLFYWLVATSILFFGNASEWATRFPTVLVSGIYVAFQYLALRFIGGSRTHATLGALALLTGSAFFVLSTRAEIDLTFGFACTTAFYASYLALQRASAAWLLAASFLAGIAFLIKGPPIIFFLGAAVVSFYLYQLYIARSPQAFRLPVFLSTGLLASLLFVGMAALWLIPIAARFGWAELADQFQVEVLERVIGEARLSRGPLFYLGAAAIGFLPWTPFLLQGIYWIVRRDPRMIAHPLGNSFAAFNLLAFALGTVMLSCAAGKSSRYLFPLYACGINLALVPLCHVPSMSRAPQVLRVVGIITAIAAPLLLIASPFISIDGVASGYLIFCASLFASSFAAIALAARRKSFAGLVAGLLILTVAARFGEATIYAPHRHLKRSVLPAVAEIDRLLPPNARLYHVELFERWITFYLKHRGRETYRITPEIAANPVATEGRVYILLSKEEESWRLTQLREADATVEVLAEPIAGRTPLILLSAKPEALRSVNPTNHFPTVPSNRSES